MFSGLVIWHWLVCFLLGNITFPVVSTSQLPLVLFVGLKTPPSSSPSSLYAHWCCPCIVMLVNFYGCSFCYYYKTQSHSNCSDLLLLTIFCLLFCNVPRVFCRCIWDWALELCILIGHCFCNTLLILKKKKKCLDEGRGLHLSVGISINI